MKVRGRGRGGYKWVWTEPELVLLRQTYAGPHAPDIHALAAVLKCSIATVCAGAVTHGLKRSHWPHRSATKDAASLRMRQGPPPATMGFTYAGHKHSAESRAKMRAASHHSRPAFTVATRVKMAQATNARLRRGGRWKGRQTTIGRRADLNNQFFRSRWEANYARFLNFLISTGAIKRWQYEPLTFWFDKIKRGSRSYTPDFLVQRSDNTRFYVEVKGWMDPKSKTKLARMARYYPHVPITLIGATEYKQLAKQWGKSLPNWE